MTEKGRKKDKGGEKERRIDLKCDGLNDKDKKMTMTNGNDTDSQQDR